MHALFEEHIKAVHRILRYLKVNPRKGLFFKKNEERRIEGYTNVDWVGSMEDRKSTSGYCIVV